MTKAIWQGLAAAVIVAATAVRMRRRQQHADHANDSDARRPRRRDGGNPTTATITIGTDGRVSPASVTIAPGGRVTIVNNHTRPHDMSSDPHPEHTQCPEINQIGFLTSGQSRTQRQLQHRAHLRLPRSQPAGQHRPAGPDHHSVRRQDVRRSGSSVSTAAEVRLPLLEIGLQAFLRIVALEETLLQLALEREAFARIRIRDLTARRA